MNRPYISPLKYTEETFEYDKFINSSSCVLDCKNCDCYKYIQKLLFPATSRKQFACFLRTIRKRLRNSTYYSIISIMNNSITLNISDSHFQFEQTAKGNQKLFNSTSPECLLNGYITIGLMGGLGNQLYAS